MIYRLNPVLPPQARSASSLRALAIIEAAARSVFTRPGGDTLLARHFLDLASLTEATDAVLEEVAKLRQWEPRDVAPTGSGRRQARDGGGHALRVVDAWASSFAASLEGRRELPYDPVMRGAWDRAHPEWGEFFSRAVWILRHTTRPAEEAESQGLWLALERAIAEDAVLLESPQATETAA